MALNINQTSTCFTCGRALNEQYVGDQYSEQFNNIFADRLSKTIGTPQFIKDPAITNFCRFCSEILIHFGKFREKCITKLEEHDTEIESKFSLCKLQPATTNDDDSEAVGWWDTYHEKQTKDFKDVDVEDKYKLFSHAIDYTCPECGLMFQSQTLYKQHYFELHDKFYKNTSLLNWCNLCKITMDIGGFSTHLREKHCETLAGGIIKCSVCSKEYLKFNLFYNHFKRHREFKEPRKCPICLDKYFLTYSKFHAHLAQTHNNEALSKENRQFKCKMCEFTTHSSMYYKSHVRIGHLGEKYCRYCKKPIQSTEWDEHYKAEARKHGYELDHNPIMRINSYQPGLLSNKKNVYECGLCYRLFSQGTITLHIRTHETKSSFSCDQCGSKFNSERNLKRHYFNMHRNTLICDLCSFTASNKGTMRRHMIKVHINQHNPDFNQISCEVCGKTYSESYIRKHLELVHSGDKQSKARKTHELVNNSQTAEICAKCGVLVQSDLIGQHKCGVADVSAKTNAPKRSRQKRSHSKNNLEPIEHVKDVPLWRTPGADEPDFEVLYEVKKVYNFLKTPKHLKVNYTHKCDECKFKTTNKLTFRTHLFNKHGTWICAICSTGCFNKADMQKHLMHRHNRELSLDLCDGPCEDREYPAKLLKIGLKDQRKITKIWVLSKTPVYKEDGSIYDRLQPGLSHIYGNIKCNYCEYGFINLLTFKHHIETQHLEELSFHCEQCIDLAYVNEIFYLLHLKTVHASNANVQLPMPKEQVGMVDSIIKHGQLYGRLKFTPGVTGHSRSKPKKRTVEEMEEDNY